ncbi:mitochondrial transcription rescue factor 1-like [Vespula squamosa]|uniref:Mitochondrial transcription rescue factor 1-like n=1 Tax=Vespula squamosa TaxID=30214 RepID=A0ABD2AIS7_VESSQ
MNKIYNIITRRSIFQSTRLLCFCHHQVRLYYHVNRDIWMNNFIQDNLNLSIIKRFKHKRKDSAKKKVQEHNLESDEDESDSELDESQSKSIITHIKVNSLRVDSIIKNGAGITRKSIETAFYESKIRINGKKVLKISTEVQVDDEIDIIRGRPNENINQLYVSRIKILSITPISDAIRIKISKDKNLLIEEYSN